MTYRALYMQTVTFHMCVHSANILSNQTSKQQSTRNTTCYAAQAYIILYYKIVIYSPWNDPSSAEMLKVISGHENFINNIGWFLRNLLGANDSMHDK